MNVLDDHVKRIKDWLDKQGYPLEMVVARSLFAQGLGYVHGSNYEDPDSGDAREIDILTKSIVENKNVLLLQAIIECKYSEQPIVAFTYNDVLKSPVEFWVPCNILGLKILNIVKQRRLGNDIPVFSQQYPTAYALKQIHKDDKKRDAAFEAIMSVVKASYYFSKLYTDKVTTFLSPNGTETKPLAYIGMPTIIFRAPLYICYLDQSGNIALEPRSSLLLEWTYPKVGTMMIRVIQEKEVAALGQSVTRSVEIFYDQLKEHI